ncbi:putative homogentisate phytyltransferase [Helianthus annuus]|nr:putative homogentisate phytyltransferase [Helianthus annuus]KAJ0710399.1 putative homogentisate phytyltransferase [Helianthus annuus]
MASVCMGSLCKPTSLLFSGVVKASSLATGAQASKILRISNSDMKESLQGRHCTNHTDKKFYNRLTPHQMKKEKFELNAASTDNPQFDATHDLINPLENAIRFVDVLYRFIRPYVAIGTVFSVLSMSLLTIQKMSDFSPLFFLKLMQALVGGMFMQMYVCGFNQICDIELDKVNKPYLPLAAGELSMTTAIIVSSISAVMGFSIAWIVGSPPLFWGFVGWFTVATAYSANVYPLLRWKRFPFMTAFYMLISKALVVPVAYYMHMQPSTYIKGTNGIFSRNPPPLRRSRNSTLWRWRFRSASQLCADGLFAGADSLDRERERERCDVGMLAVQICNGVSGGLERERKDSELLWWLWGFRERHGSNLQACDGGGEVCWRWRCLLPVWGWCRGW